jgi:hypothetical protein
MITERPFSLGGHAVTRHDPKHQRSGSPARRHRALRHISSRWAWLGLPPQTPRIFRNLQVGVLSLASHLSLVWKYPQGVWGQNAPSYAQREEGPKGPDDGRESLVEIEDA